MYHKSSLVHLEYVYILTIPESSDVVCILNDNHPLIIICQNIARPRFSLNKNSIGIPNSAEIRAHFPVILRHIFSGSIFISSITIANPPTGIHRIAGRGYSRNLINRASKGQFFRDPTIQTGKPLNENESGKNRIQYFIQAGRRETPRANAIPFPLLWTRSCKTSSSSSNRSSRTTVPRQTLPRSRNQRRVRPRDGKRARRCNRDSPDIRRDPRKSSGVSWLSRLPARASVTRKRISSSPADSEADVNYSREINGVYLSA